MIEFAYLDIRPNTTKILKNLGDILGTDKGWFISGSFANSDVEEPSDVDVYFTDEKLLDEVPSLIFNKDDICVIIQTSRAFTVNVKGIVLNIQFIKSHGTCEDILEKFDLNVCRKVLFPDGTIWKDPVSDEPLQIFNVNSCTFSRFFKYYEIYRKDSSKEAKTNIAKRIIDTFIANDDEVIDYYIGTKVISSVNEQLLKYFSKQSPELRKYVIEEALKHSPSLLI